MGDSKLNPFNSPIWKGSPFESFRGDYGSGGPLTSGGDLKEGVTVVDGGTAPPNSPSFDGQILPNNPPATPTYTAPQISYNAGATPSYLDSKSEMDFRTAYLNSLNPNVNFSIMGESNPYKNSTTPKMTGGKF